MNKNYRIEKTGKKYIINSFLIFSLMTIILFLSVGYLNFTRGWIFAGFTFLYQFCPIIILLRYNPELLNNRAKRKTNTKSYEKTIKPLNFITANILIIVICGLDAGRFNWTYLSNSFLFLGVIIYVFSIFLLSWAFFSNPFFESTACIQKDRGHITISKGPYKIIRHPGYSSELLSHIACPLLIGSIVGFLPMILAIVVTLVRTWMEDRTLYVELTGYKEYVKNVKYRIFPFIW